MNDVINIQMSSGRTKVLQSFQLLLILFKETESESQREREREKKAEEKEEEQRKERAHRDALLRDLVK